jgi:hypothetical protein
MRALLLCHVNLFRSVNIVSGSLCHRANDEFTSKPSRDFCGGSEDKMGSQCVEMISERVFVRRIRKDCDRQCQFFGKKPDCCAKRESRHGPNYRISFANKAVHTAGQSTESVVHRDPGDVSLMRRDRPCS